MRTLLRAPLVLSVMLALAGAVPVVPAAAVGPVTDEDALRAAVATGGRVVLGADLHGVPGGLVLGADVELDLAGHLLRVSATSGPGIRVPADGALTVTDSGGPGTGQLVVEGGSDAAGIGGGPGESVGEVTVAGGVVTATGGPGGAGIGSGAGGEAGVVRVTGGSVRAVGGRAAAGVGGGDASDGGSVHVTGGALEALGGTWGAGLGGGLGGGGGEVVVHGGSVEASGGTSAAGIGSGDLAPGPRPSPVRLEVHGGAVVAEGGDGAAGVGGGASQDGGDVVVAGGHLVARGGDSGAGVGGGEVGRGGIVVVRGGAVDATGGRYAAAVGSGEHYWSAGLPGELEVHGRPWPGSAEDGVAGDAYAPGAPLTAVPTDDGAWFRAVAGPSRLQVAVGWAVTVDPAGGAPGADPQFVPDGGLLEEVPTAPERDFHTFSGWLADGVAWDPTAPVTGPLTLVAGWEPVRHTVSLDVAGGVAVGPVLVAHGSPAVPPTPVRPGYTFLGWLLDGLPYDDAPVLGDLVLTATWVPVGLVVPAEVDAGETVPVEVTGLRPGVTYEVLLDPVGAGGGAVVLGTAASDGPLARTTATADATGTLTVALVPPREHSGPVLVRVRDAEGADVATATVMVLAAPEEDVPEEAEPDEESRADEAPADEVPDEESEADRSGEVPEPGAAPDEGSEAEADGGAGAAPALAATGLEAFVPLVLAGALVAAGGLLLVGARRRSGV